MIGDIDRYLAAAVEAVEAAGSVIRPYFRSALPADLKADQSPVTIADREAELAMRAVLQRLCPECGIMGEEFGAGVAHGVPHGWSGKAPAAGVQGTSGSDPARAALRWVLDPIDGTRAFITGRPTFGTLVALLDGEVPVLGIIDQPVTQERWIGAAGRPTAFHGRWSGQVGTRACAGLAQAELSATSPEMFGNGESAADNWPSWRRLAARVRRTSWGGDCYAYGLLALGQIDVIAECDLKLWDWAALLPVIEGAGGRLTDWQGRPPRPDGDGRIIAVGDPGLLDHVVEALRPVNA